MDYDPIKKGLGRWVRGQWGRYLFHQLLLLLFPRAWWVKRGLERWFSRGLKHPLFLDVGMGFGQFSDFLLRRYPQCRGVGLEVDEDHWYGGERYFRQFGRRFFLVLGDAQALPFKNDVFNLAFAVDVMEHLPDDLSAVSEIRRTVQPQGTFLLHTPRIRDPISEAKGESQRDKERWRVEEHFRDGYRDEDMEGLLRGGGFALCRLQRSYGAWGRRAWIILQKIPLTLASWSRWLLLLVALYLLIAIPFGLLFIALDLRREDHPDGGGLLAWGEKGEG